MSMDVRQFKTGSIARTTHANIAAALAARRNFTSGSVFNEWAGGDGFVELDTGYGDVIYIFLTDNTGVVYQVTLQSLST